MGSLFFDELAPRLRIPPTHRCAINNFSRVIDSTIKAIPMVPRGGYTILRRTWLRCRNSRKTYSILTPNAADRTQKTRIYLSRILDPYINLSIEQFLLQKTAPDCTVLFLYTNRPCIVIGRNQNPWVEVNLGLLKRRKAKFSGDKDVSVELVRRRSGGGTVFHDMGNVNYSVICPTGSFDRNKHAEMVARALRGLGVDNAKVNNRHDIVLDEVLDEPDDPGIGRGPNDSVELPRFLKVSGSAYKITRLKSLHHGTCLLSSPNIKTISQYLRSPAKPYIQARGVDSVSSPIANVNLQNEAFEEAVTTEFRKLYGDVAPVVFSEDVIRISEVARGLEELKSTEWIYSQTPQFTFSTHKTKEDTRDKPPLPDYVYPGISTTFTVRKGIISQVNLTVDGIDIFGIGPEELKALVGKELHKIGDWTEALPEPLSQANYGISRWLNGLFGNGFDIADDLPSVGCKATSKRLLV